MAAVTKSVSLFKLPSNDLFTAPALLRGLSAVAPGHPLEQSFAAVYWRGGDAAVESVLLRPQFFDKLIVWGGTAVHAAVSAKSVGLLAKGSVVGSATFSAGTKASCEASACARSLAAEATPRRG